ncbi:MAG: hypothetical protein Ta2B_10430 [Termitinemataceae bacterium]|nr:MAG: hypothetical protein Ta2B_10430 [Termitinemataceae bacterium]
MKEKSIIFSTEMVQALLNTKPNTYPPEPIDARKPCNGMTRRAVECKGCADCLTEFSLNFICRGNHIKPKYQAGDVLWVRETWSQDGISYKYVYKADASPAGEVAVLDDYSGEMETFFPNRRFSPILMRCEAARLFLKVRNVRVERLQDISEEDAIMEGVDANCDKCGVMNCKGDDYPICRFRILWDSINAKRGYGWDTNPYVWVYEFERV